MGQERWQQDHARLWVLCQEAVRWGHAWPELQRGLAEALERHALREERAFLEVGGHPMVAHLRAEHRDLEGVLDAILAGRRVFMNEDLAFLRHHFAEEEAWVAAHVPGWSYRPLEGEPVFRFLPREFLDFGGVLGSRVS